LKLLGIFRVPREVELKGLDIFKHGEPAYPLVAYGHGWDDDTVGAETMKYFSKTHAGLGEVDALAGAVEIRERSNTSEATRRRTLVETAEQQAAQRAWTNKVQDQKNVQPNEHIIHTHI